jgi:hypothetical protein
MRCIELTFMRRVVCLAIEYEYKHAAYLSRVGYSVAYASSMRDARAKE